jgi:hypothetical protein
VAGVEKGSHARATDPHGFVEVVAQSQSNGDPEGEGEGCCEDRSAVADA